MGADEAVPFSDKAAADKFAQENGGRVVTYAMPKEYALEHGGRATSSRRGGGRPARSTTEKLHPRLPSPDHHH